MKNSYGVSCTSTEQCNSVYGLICPSASGTCNCPLNSSTVFCDCIRVPNNESFWNGSSCQPSISVNGKCLNVSSSYMCQTMTQNTICIGSGSNFTCQCALMNYFDPFSNSCKNVIGFNRSCNVSIQNMCISPLYCYSGICEYLICLFIN